MVGVLVGRYDPGTRYLLTLLGPQSRFLGKSYLEFGWFVPKNGTAVRQGFTLSELQSRFGDKLLGELE